MKKSLIIFAVVSVLMVPLFTVGLSAAPLLIEDNVPSRPDGLLTSLGPHEHYCVIYNFSDSPLNIWYSGSSTGSGTDYTVPANSSYSFVSYQDYFFIYPSSGVYYGLDFDDITHTGSSVNVRSNTVYVADDPSVSPTSVVSTTFGSFFTAIGLFISSLFTGELSGLLIVFAIGIAVSALAFGIKAIKGFTWGS